MPIQSEMIACSPQPDAEAGRKNLEDGDPFAPASDPNVRLSLAPSNPREFHSLAVRMAEILQPMARSPFGGLPLRSIPGIAAQSETIEEHETADPGAPADNGETAGRPPSS